MFVRISTPSATFGAEFQDGVLVAGNLTAECAPVGAEFFDVVAAVQEAGGRVEILSGGGEIAGAFDGLAVQPADLGLVGEDA